MLFIPLGGLVLLITLLAIGLLLFQTAYYHSLPDHPGGAYIASLSEMGLVYPGATSQKGGKVDLPSGVNRTQIKGGATTPATAVRGYLVRDTAAQVYNWYGGKLLPQGWYRVPSTIQFPKYIFFTRGDREVFFIAEQPDLNIAFKPTGRISITVTYSVLEKGEKYGTGLLVPTNG